MAVPPFAPPLGEYYNQIYEPVIGKAGLRRMRVDAEIFGTGKIMDQVWSESMLRKCLSLNSPSEAVRFPTAFQWPDNGLTRSLG